MGKSKRQLQRLNHTQQTLRNKGIQQEESALDLLSDELKEQLLKSGGDAEQLIMLPGSKKQSAADKAEPAADSPGPELSKSQLRKLKQVQLKKERRDNIAQVVDKLSANALTDAHLALLRPLHQRGARETKKQRLRRALQLERAGVAPSAEQAEELYRPRKPVVDSEDSDGGSEGSGGGSEGRALMARGQNGVAAAGGAAAPSAATLPAASARPQHAGSESDTSDSDRDSDSDSRAAAGRKVQQGVGASQQAELKAREQRVAARITEDADPEELKQIATAKQQAAAAAAEARRVAAAGGRSAGLHRVVDVQRPPAMQAARQGLPILAMEQEIIECVSAHDVVVLCGETGCGKTTQVPQFLLEAGYGCTTFPERAGCVGVTQPRRVAATSTAERVAAELGTELGEVVGYQVRYDHVVGSATRIKFMTDGILLRELQDDFLLRRYSVLLVDEAHERSLNTDLLLGMLSRVVALRRKLCTQQQSQPGYSPDSPEAVHPLKLIIMSATLRTSDFVDNRKLFAKPPPVIEVPARQFPVTIHFSRRTEQHDYLGAVFKKVVRIHRELPPGGVLVFLTGQREVEFMCRRLRQHFGGRAGGGGGGGTDPADMEVEGGDGQGGADEAVGGDAFGDDLAEATAAGDLDNAEMMTTGGRDRGGGGSGGVAMDGQLDDYDAGYDSEVDGDEEEVVVLGGESMSPEEIAAAEKRFEEQYGFQAGGVAGGRAEEAGAPGPTEDPTAPRHAPVHVLPLYAMLPASAQARVFQPPPEGHRLIVVATNVAETSLTIPGIRYVVDAGRSKQRLLEDASGGMARFEVRWVSQAAAAQRAGRAGRTGPGHTYRMYSSAHYNDCMPVHTPPEIVNTALEGVVLVLKSMGVDKVGNFPFPSPPEPDALRAAERCLVALCALDPATQALTAVGRAMAAFPIGPRHARMLLEVVAWQLRLAGAATEAAGNAGSRPPPLQVANQALPFAVALAAALSVENPFMHLDNPNQSQAAQAQGEGRDDDEEQNARQSAHESKAAKDAAHTKASKARQAQARLRVADSDALSALRALCGFEAAEDPQVFCEQHHLHYRQLQEAAELHKQLLRVLASPPAGALASTDSQAPSLAARLSQLVSQQGLDLKHLATSAAASAASSWLSSPVQDCLRRAVAVGWVDCVARRVRTAEQLARLQQQGSGKRHAIRYVSCALASVHSGTGGSAQDQSTQHKRAAQAAEAQSEGAGAEGEDLSGDVFLHPRSALHAAAPELLAYTQIVRTAKRPYMAGCTSIKGEWLIQSGTPLASWSPPLTEPPPCYRQPPQDAVVAWHEVTYGRHGWVLPRCLRPLGDVKKGAPVFAAALLDGQIVQAMTGFRDHWLNAPAVAARPEMQGVARVGELVGTLVRHRVTSLSALVACWQRDGSFLQREVKAWLPASQHSRLAQQWPGMVRQAIEQEQQRQSQQQQQIQDEQGQAGHSHTCAPRAHNGKQQPKAKHKKRSAAEQQAADSALAGARQATELLPSSKQKRKNKKARHA